MYEDILFFIYTFIMQYNNININSLFIFTHYLFNINLLFNYKLIESL